MRLPNLLRSTVLLGALLLAASSAPAQPTLAEYGARYAALCASCHGADGRSQLPGTPSLAGQHSFYAVTQLFLFRAGRRANPEMTAVAKPLSDNDLRGFADWIGTLPPAPAQPAAAGDPARLYRAQILARQRMCTACHLPDFTGGGHTPRLAGQREEYLQKVLREFKAGQRVGYTPAMNEALVGMFQQDMDDLAHLISRLPAPPARAPMNEIHKR